MEYPTTVACEIEQSNPGISDDELLELIEERYLVLGPDNQVWKFHRSQKQYIPLKIIYHSKSGRAQHAIRLDDRYRKIGRAKLLWMLQNQRVVPRGYDVDHVDHDRHNDDFENLRLRDHFENSSDNYSKRSLDECCEYFDEVGFVGYGQ